MNSPELYLIAIDASGNQISGAQLQTTVAGSTTLPKSLYADKDLTIPHPNPLVADASGVFPQFFLEDGGYRFDLRTPAGAQVRGPRDYIYGCGAGFAPAASDHKIAMDASDVADYAPAKIVGSSSIQAVLLPGTSKQLQLSVLPSGIAGIGKVKASAADSTSDVLEGKIQPYVGLSIDLATGTAGYQWLNLSSLGYACVGSGDTIWQGTLDAKLDPGPGISMDVVYSGSGAGNKLRISSEGTCFASPGDTVQKTLSEKVRAGAGITITEVVDSVNGVQLWIDSKANLWAPVKQIAESYSLTDSDGVVTCSGTITVALPAPAAAYKGRSYIIQAASATASVEVTAAGTYIYNTTGVGNPASVTGFERKTYSCYYSVDNAAWRWFQS